VPVGTSVMRGAVDNNVPGIDADCGGEGGFKWSSQQDLLAYRSTRQTDPAFAHREARDLAS